MPSCSTRTGRATGPTAAKVRPAIAWCTSRTAPTTPASASPITPPAARTSSPRPTDASIRPTPPSAPRLPSACPTRGRRTSVGGRAEVELGDGDLPHLDLADLAGHGHREGVDHLHVPWDLVVCEPAGAELAQRLRRQVGCPVA